MKRHSIKRVSDGKITHAPTSDDPNFIPKIPKGWGLENNYEIIVEDITQELANIEQLKVEKSQARQRLKILKLSDVDDYNLEDIKDVLKDILKVLA